MLTSQAPRTGLIIPKNPAARVSQQLMAVARSATGNELKRTLVCNPLIEGMEGVRRVPFSVYR